MPVILLVDDCLTDRRLAGHLLEQQAETRVLYASNGREALLQLEQEVPDLIITDLQMPEIDGLELVRRVRQSHPQLPVILITAVGSEELAVAALHEGAASYVPKRVMVQDLWPQVQSVLGVLAAEQGWSQLMKRAQTVSFVLENDLPLLTSLTTYLQDAFVVRGLSEESERVRIGIALEEALLNAYYHGNLEVSSHLREQDYSAFYDLARERCGLTPYKDRKIRVTVEFQPGSATVVIRDDGPGFDVSALPDPTAPEYIERPSGRGVLLMRTFMDEVRYNACGNQVTLVKRRSVPSVTAVSSTAKPVS